MAYQGMQFELASLSRPGLVIALFVGAVAGKLIGGYLVGRMQRMNAHDAWGVGIVMNAHGVMELVVAAIALEAGLIDREVFSALLVVGMATTMLTPIMLDRWRAHAPLAIPASEQRPSH
jgi:Kef-type K+ transport system membrane component KefB